MDQASISSEGSGKPQEGQSKAGPPVEGKTVKKTSRLAVASAVFVILAILCFAATCGFGTHDVIMPSIVFVAFVLSGVAVVLGITALVVIAIHRKEVGGCGYAIISIIVAGFFLSAVSPAILRLREKSRGIWCKHNLHQLGLAINEYAKAHDGRLPTVATWCDLLVEHNQDLSKDLFQCPTARGGSCNYAFNKNLGGLRLADVPDEVVLIFEAETGWNLSGGGESLKMRHSRKQMRCNILFSDLGVRSCCEEDFAEEPLRWKP